MNSTKETTAHIDAQIRALPERNTPSVRAVRRATSRQLKQARPELVLDVARDGEAELEEFGWDIDSWWTVDAFARTLSGPAWLAGQVEDAVIHRWARSEDLWWRRAALVSTVALNIRSHGGYGDTPRTLAVCRMLVADHEDMVVKALSWALRALVVHDPEAVQAFLNEDEDVLATRVKREVTNKLTTGLKNP